VFILFNTYAIVGFEAFARFMGSVNPRDAGGRPPAAAAISERIFANVAELAPRSRRRGLSIAAARRASSPWRRRNGRANVEILGFGDDADLALNHFSRDVRFIGGAFSGACALPPPEGSGHLPR
jgi:hypothetical protein